MSFGYRVGEGASRDASVLRDVGTASGACRRTGVTVRHGE
eukprot:CAMPEP_0176235786 /NCGR_PEP_ID=MMETSP0121_2-20121125/27012_1 /TAXON_ID=160619 /ORGANISM="Kryptoperidinium foliaceum, Strain CCMP 1326" /LENGTH=39 /DNA_ID= /DNA_START= /DNA_END= /DNA_ORIENTATION=